MASADATSLKGLLSKITGLVNEISAAADKQKLKQCTFEADSPDELDRLPPQFHVKREILADLCQDMMWLVQGPKHSVVTYNSCAMADVATLNTLNHFNFWAAVPLKGDASLEEIAKSVKLPVEAVERTMKHAVTMRFFAKVKPAADNSRIKHTARSAVLAKDPDQRSHTITTLDNSAVPLAVFPRALEEWSQGQQEFCKEPGKRAFNYAFSGGHLGEYSNMWDMLDNDGKGDRKGWRAQEMVRTQRSLRDTLDMSAAILRITDWSGHKHLVDLGGSGGHDDICLAEKFPNLKITVQDLPKCELMFDKTFPKQYRDRVQFMAHDFFTPETVEADIYMMKTIMYDWTRAEAVKILRGVIPVMRPGVKIVMMELCIQSLPSGIVLPRALQRNSTAMDVGAMAMFGKREHSVQDLLSFWKEADERFEVTRVDESQPPIVMLEIKWRG